MESRSPNRPIGNASQYQTLSTITSRVWAIFRRFPDYQLVHVDAMRAEVLCLCQIVKVRW